MIVFLSCSIRWILDGLTTQAAALYAGGARELQPPSEGAGTARPDASLRRGETLETILDEALAMLQIAEAEVIAKTFGIDSFSIAFFSSSEFFIHFL